MKYTIGFAFLFISAIAFSQNTYTYTQPKQLEDGLETASLQSQNIDTTRIYHFFNQAINGGNKLHSILLLKDNKLVLEEYLNKHTIDEQHDLRSATKSIRSLLVGIAIDKGFINNVDDPIEKYLKTPTPTENLNKQKNEITIKHLLTMSAGWDCNDGDKKSEGQEDKVYRKKDWLQHTVNLPMVNTPGEVSNYCTMGTVLVAEIVSQTSGMSIDKFAKKYLFNPLGITNVSWGHTSKKEVIPSSKRLYMTSRDMAKIGQLILNEGKWRDKQIVSKAWVNESTSPKTKMRDTDYGYLWWNIPFKIEDKIIPSKTASGNGGQCIIVIPEFNMVAVFTGGAYNSEEANLPFYITNNVFLSTLLLDKK